MKNKTTAGLLAIFLGGIGMHKFYLNKGGQGLLYLLFCWLYFIPAIIGFFEGIRYLTMSEESFNAEYNSNTSAPPVPGSPHDLEKLFELKEKGILSEEEYNTQKMKYLK